MTDKSKFTAFRCPTTLYDELLKDSKNKSEIIVSALESYQPKEFRENLFDAYIQLSKLFHAIGLHFKNRTTLGTNEFVNFIEAYITNTQVIDKIEGDINELSKRT